MSAFDPKRTWGGAVILRANDARSALSALLHVADVQPVGKPAGAIALLRQRDPDHAGDEHARHKRRQLATHSEKCSRA